MPASTTLAKLAAARAIASKRRSVFERDADEPFATDVICPSHLPPVTDVVPHGEVGGCSVAPAIARRAWLTAIEQEERVRLAWRQARIDASRKHRRRHERDQAPSQASPGITSRFRGVSWDQSQNSWAAEICVGGRAVPLGHFGDEELAARIYDAAARDYGVPERQNLPGKPLP